MSLVLLLTETQDKIWDLKLKGFQDSEIASKLGISRQAVNKTVRAIRSKLADFFLFLSKIIECDIAKLDLNKGIFVGRLRYLDEIVYGCYIPFYGPILVSRRVLSLENVESINNIKALFEFAKKYFLFQFERINNKALKKLFENLFEKVKIPH